MSQEYNINQVEEDNKNIRQFLEERLKVDVGEEEFAKVR